MTTPYRPANGTEGEAFRGRTCAKCWKYRKGRCAIISAAFVYDVGHRLYPKEWVRLEDGTPKCTAFQSPGERPPRKPRNPIKPAKDQASLF